MWIRILIILLFILVVVYVLNIFSHKSVTLHTKKVTTMTISSPAFANNASIPSKYTCDGEGINPPLQFKDVPTDAKSLVMLMDDPDVPKNLKPDGVFDHWTIYNIDPKVTDIPEGTTPPGTQGLNGAGQEKYTPACPPDRQHRYFFRLYALDTMLDFSDPLKVTKEMAIEKMQGHIIEQAELVGLYNRPQNK